MQELGSVLPWRDIAGLSVFAVSGVLAAVRMRVDFIGACFFALVTIVGGGTLRDILTQLGIPAPWPAILASRRDLPCEAQPFGGS